MMVCNDNSTKPYFPEDYESVVFNVSEYMADCENKINEPEERNSVKCFTKIGGEQFESKFEYDFFIETGFGVYFYDGNKNANPDSWKFICLMPKGTLILKDDTL